MQIAYDTKNVFQIIAGTETHRWHVAAFDATHGFAGSWSLGGGGAVAYVGHLDATNTVDSFGQVQTSATANDDGIAVLTLDATHGVMAWWEGNNLRARVVTLTPPTTLAVGTAVTLATSTSGSFRFLAGVGLDSTHGIFAYVDSSSQVSAVAFSVSGTTITAGTPATVDTAASDIMKIARDPNTTDTVVIFYAPNATVVSVSGTTLTVGTPQAVSTAGTEPAWGVTITPASKVIVVYQNAATGFGTMRELSRSGTTLTLLGSPTTVSGSSAGSPQYADIATFRGNAVLTAWVQTADTRIHFSGSDSNPPTPVKINEVQLDATLHVAYFDVCALSPTVAFMAFREETLDAYMLTLGIGVVSSGWHVGGIRVA